jgi:hypothetical protein
VRFSDSVQQQSVRKRNRTRYSTKLFLKITKTKKDIFIFKFIARNMIYSFSDEWLVPHHCNCYVFYFIFGYRDEIFLGLAVDRNFCRLIAPGQRATPQLLATLYCGQSRLKRFRPSVCPSPQSSVAPDAVGMRRP